MCQPGLTTKFCTCADEADLSYPIWELWRSDEPDDSLRLHVVGEIMRPSLEHELLVDRLAQDLNRPDAFDTNLGFRDGDSMILRFDEIKAYAFQFDDGKWRERLWGAREIERVEDGPFATGVIQRIAR